VLCLPVILRNREALGALYCVSRQSGQLRLLERDRVFLSACSTVVALALENIMLVSKARERARAEERSAQRRRYSPVIHRLLQERENLSLKLHDFRATRLYGLDEPANRELQAFVKKAVRADVPVLLLGETGVGKTALAHYLHEQSRPSLPFVTVDCAAISTDLIESELFGHEKGAFTGAYARKTGKIAAAGRGTVFVDEIGDLNSRLQGKLLRLIESGEYEPVGSTRTQRSSARLVFATNRDLAAEVEAKTFREDLYYRLNVLSHTIAPLYERKEFIVPLAEYFLKAYAARMGSGVEEFTEDAREAMLAHRWPGNIRELENAVMRALIEVAEGRIDAGALQLTEHSTTAAQAAGERKVSALEDLDLKAARERLDREYIQRALALCDRNVSQAARKLNLSRNSLSDLIKKYNL
jgi:transcriptional regulator with PAS, ATPase and Fis domain